jgi:hypothetical protein
VLKVIREYSLIPENKEIIESWFIKAKNSNENPFDKFNALWISFNSFYTSPERYAKARTLTTQRNIPEYIYLESFCSEKKYNDIYLNLVKNSDIFTNKLNYFLKLLDEKTRFKGKIADLRQDMRNNEKFAKSFSDIENLEEFIFVTYQIRCNLIHGNKSTKNKGDNDIITAIFAPFIQFLEIIYEDEGYFVN